MNQSKVSIKEKVYEALLHIETFEYSSKKTILDYALEQAIGLTDSKIGYIYFYNEKTQELVTYSWSKDVMDECTVTNPETLYHLDHTGLWGEAVRQRKPMITNDYLNESSYKKGIPKGHVKLVNHMNVPIFSDDKIVALIGVANKNGDYVDEDVTILNTLMSYAYGKTVRFDMERKLIQNELYFKSIFEQSSTGICQSELDGTIINANKAFTEITGYPLVELIGRTIKDITYPEDLDEDLTNIKRLIDGKIDSFYMEKRYLTKLGEISWVMINVSLLQDIILDKQYLIGMVQDINEKKAADLMIKKYWDHLEELVEIRADELFKSKRMLQLILNTIPQRVYWKDENLKLFGFNQSFLEDSKELSFNEILEKRVENHASGKLENNLTDDEKKIINGNLTINGVERQIVSDSGKKRWIRETKMPLKDRYNEIFGILGTYEDITQIKEAESEVELFFNTTLDMLCLADLNGYFTRLSPAWNKVLGWSDEELMAVPFLDFVLDEDKESTIEATKILSKGGQDIDFINRYRCKDGSFKWIEWRSISDIEKGIIIAAARDVTEKKQQENIIKLAKEAAENANKAKSEFLANMSHEIRTPLNAVLGFSEILYNELKDENYLSYVDSIRVAGKSLLTLINDILDLSKIEAGMMTIQIEPIKLNTIFNEIKQIFGQRVKEKGLEFIIEVDEQLPNIMLLDEVRLRQILLNLVGNAVKFTDLGSIKLTARKLKLETAKDEIAIQISVEDTGIGIPLENQESIFDAFTQQMDQNNRKYEGTGLGLAICKKLAEMMNGKIELDSKVGVGSTFTMTINPVKTALLNPIDESLINIYPESFVFENCKILVVDDIESNRRLMNVLLAESGFSVLSAENGRIAVDIAVKEIPDVILMDIRMPVLNGIEATQLLKTFPKTKQIPVIALTASVTKSEQENVMDSGFESLLIKPISQKQLLSELAKVLPQKVRITSIDLNNDETDVFEREIDFSRFSQETIQSFMPEVLPLALDLSKSMRMSKVTKLDQLIRKIASESLDLRLNDFSNQFEHLVKCKDVIKLKKIIKKMSQIKESNQ